ncbi:unnamed protein product, partial [Discosporangium mesarthrocarpum]
MQGGGAGVGTTEKVYRLVFAKVKMQSLVSSAMGDPASRVREEWLSAVGELVQAHRLSEDLLHGGLITSDGRGEPTTGGTAREGREGSLVEPPCPTSPPPPTVDSATMAARTEDQAGGGASEEGESLQHRGEGEGGGRPVMIVKEARVAAVGALSPTLVAVPGRGGLRRRHRLAGTPVNHQGLEGHNQEREQGQGQGREGW